jgi:opacity protein-like surface antigen
VVHGERFSTRWGFAMNFGQMVDIGYPGNRPTNFDRSAYSVYVQGNLNIVNGIGKTWYLTAGPTYNWYSIDTKDSNGSSSTSVDKTSKVGVLFGTGVSFNGKTMRWTPEFLVSKVGEETTGIFRLHIQYQF